MTLDQAIDTVMMLCRRYNQERINPESLTAIGKRAAIGELSPSEYEAFKLVMDGFRRLLSPA